ncbi:MAG: TonB-dependent receptor [Chlorobi bacterium]|nr:TonB-dependent receptor [Chlorobiota bacterium]
MKKHFLILFLSLSILVSAQNNTIITVIDKISKEPVQFAHVLLTPGNSGEKLFATTDSNGRASFYAKGNYLLNVSFLGYKTYTDTIEGGSNINVMLKPESFKIDDVVVTGQAMPVKADKSIYNIKVLDLKREEGKAAPDLYHMLNTESNIRLQQDMRVGGKMTMQGLTGDYVKILVDGVPVTGRMDGNIDITQINMNDVDHIEIVEGPLSVIYGSGALAGTINIITKEMKQDGMNVYASTYTESVGIISGDASVMYKKGRNSFGISGMGYNFNGWDDSDTLYRSQAWNPKTKFNTSGYYSYNVNNMKLKATANFFNENMLNRGEPFGDRNQNAFDFNYITRRLSVETRGSHFIKDKYNVDVLLAYNYYLRLNKTTFLDFDNNTSTLTKTDSTRFDQITSRMIYSSAANKKLSYSTGFDIFWEAYSGDRVMGGRQDIGDYAGFATLNYKPLPAFEIQPGIRLMYNTMYSAPVVYSFNILHNARHKWQNRFSFSRGFKSPDLKQLYLDLAISTVTILGNPDLDAEDSYNLNINSTYNIDKDKFLYSFSAKGFYNKINNKIELVTINNDNMRWTYVNINEVRSAGYGLDFSFKNYPHYSFTLSWTRTGLWNSFNNIEDSPDKYTWYSDITSTFNYSFRKPGIDLSLNYKFNGKSPQYILIDDRAALYERDKYNMMDFSASKRLLKNKFKVMAGVKNIFNVTDVKQTLDGNDYISVRGSDLIAYGRSWFLKITYSL